MLKLLILADDLTGALDSGVQLTNKGYTVQVCTDLNNAFEYTDLYDVLVIDTESRHISSDSAYELIHFLAKKAINLGFEHIYKKTDSGLRGNVGAELSALRDATGQKVLNFVPAYPKLNRITKNGIHFVNGVPLAESVFANDVLDPVNVSSVEELIHLQSNVNVSINETDGIIVYDCESDSEMNLIAEKIFNEGNYPISAGCAGLLEAFPLNPNKQVSKDSGCLNENLIVITGSMNEVSLNQIDHAVKKGATRHHAPMNLIVNEKWSESAIDVYTEALVRDITPSTTIILDTQQSFEIEQPISREQIGKIIAKCMGVLVYRMISKFPDYTFMIIGGDTLHGFMQELGIHSLSPVKEIVPGVVLAKYIYKENEHYLVTKSGAFGSDNLIEQVESFIKKESRRNICH